MRDFKGKVAIITGAASGIGYGLAERCAKEGMKVVLAGINENNLKQAEKGIKKTGTTTLVVKTDVSKATDVEALAQKTLNAFGAVHLLFNNAGVIAGTNIWKSTLNDWQLVLGVNLWGVIHGIHYFVPIMLSQNTECYIVNTASVMGLYTGAGMSCPYHVTKHGVVALSEVLYREMETGGHKIGVSVLCPGIINTKILDGERNRPKELKNKPGEGLDMTDPKVQDMIRSLKEIWEKGMPPQRVADIVFKAIREKIFYILPNAEPFMPVIQGRMEDIVKQRNPTIIPLDLK